jgi:hypothetical protein
MSKVQVVESRSDRAEIARDAGMGKLSLVSVLAGTLVAYGAFAVLAAIAAAVLQGVGFNTDLSTQEWHQLGVAGGIVVATVLFLSYMFGGYVAGRMARRAGVTNGLMVFVVGILLMVGLASIVTMFRDTGEILLNLRTIGVPVSASEWGQVATVAGLGSLAAMLFGAVIGGGLGERWHGKLVTRAFDPEVGAGVPELPVIMADASEARTSSHVVEDGSGNLTRRDAARARLDLTDHDDKYDYDRAEELHNRTHQTVGGGRLIEDNDNRDNIVVRPTDRDR